LLRKKLGLIVNPIAGMGGRVGLKGTDGAEIITEARRLGAAPESPQRTAEALRLLRRIKDEVELFTCPHEMGENVAHEAGFAPITIGSISSGDTTGDDTQRAAKDMKKLGVDLLLFAGGDGTARDIYGAVRRDITCLGIPAGVKIHSAVFAVTPRHAGEIAVSFLQSAVPRVTEGEVMDIDEVSFRRGIVAARLYGYLRIPEERRYMQGVKSGGIRSEKQAIQGIAAELITSMKADWVYVFGPGTTTRDILAELGLEKTLLGVDAILNRRMIAKDVNERQLAQLLNGRKAKIVVTVIGGQGYILGRGNQQLSPEIIKRVGKDNIIVVATKEKLASLGGRLLLVDTGSKDADRMLGGYVRVITGLNDYVMYKVGT
jgi:predicted polyphosphate/ATP-dependent NAD kinase